ncbi:MAG: amidase [Alphaproteobacteria bacterium]|nr:amidase [Alphaproteobacteria bacterium]
MINSNLETPLTLRRGIAQIRAGKLKPSLWAQQCCDIIDRYDSALKAWSYYDREQALANARKLDTLDWNSKKPPPVLAGAPLGVKDIFNTIEHPNSMGSPTRQGYWPGNDARVVAWARLLGAQILGKTTTAEFAVHHQPETLNPWNSDRIAGTSSTGSAVAVATGMVPAAFGTQSAASIARPSSYTGVVGFKPSFGLIPRTGVLKTCDTLDTIGWMTRNVEDAELLLQALRVKGHNYPIIEGKVSAYIEKFSKAKKFRIALVQAPGFENTSQDSWNKTKDLALQLNNHPDIDVIELDLREELNGSHDTHAKIYNKSLAYYFKRELRAEELISHIFKEIVEEAKEISQKDYFEALTRQETLSETVEEKFQNCDFFLLPSTAGEAVPIDQKELRDPSLIWTLTGCPVVCMPLLKGVNGLPVGVSLVGAKYNDFSLLSFAKKYVMPEDCDICTVNSQR